MPGTPSIAGGPAGAESVAVAFERQRVQVDPPFIVGSLVGASRQLIEGDVTTERGEHVECAVDIHQQPREIHVLMMPR
jgi:hypothetical protein